MHATMTEFVTIGKILKPHGIRGFFKVLPTTDDPARFSGMQSIRVRRPGTNAVQTYQPEKIQVQAHALLIKLQGVDTRNDAELLRNCEIVVKREECMPLDDESYYIFDLIGIRVETVAGKPVGTIREVLQYPANDIYVVDTGDDDVLIPAVGHFIKQIDLENALMVIEPIEGLLPEA
ncbi:MAG TPA: 16S rRNA processing protein RimM [Bacteroidetes bacterium]|nr:16S rRNA processing protein RimM [Bacteroidota bacterium]